MPVGSTIVAVNPGTLMAITAAVTIALLLVLRLASRLNDQQSSLRSRRRAGVLQLSKWAVLVLGVGVLSAEALVAAGVSSATMALILAASVSGMVLALRDSIADFVAAAAMLVERTAAIGDEVELNGEVRGRLVGFGLRSVAIRTWGGDTVFHSASGIKTFRNLSVGASRAVVDIDIPPNVRTGRATAVLTAALARVQDDIFQSQPEVLGVVQQHLDRYVIRVTCMVEPAQNARAEYLLKSAAVDAVAELLDDHGDPRPTQEILAIVADPPHAEHEPPLRWRAEA